MRESYGATRHEQRECPDRLSVLYALENDSIVDAKFERLVVEERSLGKEHLDVLAWMGLDLGKRKGIVILDMIL